MRLGNHEARNRALYETRSLALLALSPALQSAWMCFLHSSFEHTTGRSTIDLHRRHGCYRHNSVPGHKPPIKPGQLNHEECNMHTSAQAAHWRVRFAKLEGNRALR